MGLFGLFGKKESKPAEAPACCEGCSAQGCGKSDPAPGEGAYVKVLGSGCAKCNQLEAATKAALQQLGMDTTIDHVTDFGQIAAYGVMTTPALVVGGRVVSFGKVLKAEEVAALIKAETDRTRASQTENG